MVGEHEDRTAFPADQGGGLEPVLGSQVSLRRSRALDSARLLYSQLKK